MGTNYKKELAEYFYREQGLSVEEICKRVKISRGTLYRWIKEGNWQKTKLSRELSAMQLADELRWHIHEIQKKARQENRPLNATEIDSISKLLATIEKLNPKITWAANIIEGLEKFHSFLKSRYPELAREIIDPMMQFISEVGDVK
ncbi:MAG: helix-turn-helix domain-containing protein [Archaeoglobus sp.]|nr:helix-turn-helix domain-containing protein [Archaeoglobus sp.]